MPVRLPLEGITVIDISHLAAGPWCTMVLADLGANVIKIERPGVGDMSRNAGGTYAGDHSAVFLSFNRNKRSVALDLKDPRGRETLYQLLSGADVFVENLRAGKADQLGLGYADLAKINPGLVYASISAFGTDGPYADLPGNDPIIQALSGAMSITGEQDGPPARQGVSVPDFGAGMMAAFSITAALFGRATTGSGCKLDLNLLDVEIFALGPRAQEHLITGEDQPRLGSAHPQFAPYQAFRCRDGRYLYIAAINEKFWHLLCEALGTPELAEDERYATNVDRCRNRESLVAYLQDILDTRDRDDWLGVLGERGMPCAPVNTLTEAVHDPQVVHNELVQRFTHRGLGELSTVALPLRLDGARLPIRLAPPELGEHTEELLAELGTGAEDA
ncbi:CaiB/BaiF CoA transferase family protein [Streptomyces purpurogeneiscleroticus]|uniref:CaiB/BaiF CoA transferase family protein n=1 Tax=Streptomyces purpurogeneiscleroticus TaxID=68259 RepID=UPI001CBACF2B|nr:CoA transferase [Streptomyces purpurogeneiscleroticus]